MAKQGKVRPGALFCIPLAKDAIAVGIVLHVSERLKNGILVGLYDQLLDSKASINPELLPDRFVDTSNYTGMQLLTQGIWEIVADGSALLDEVTIPKRELLALSITKTRLSTRSLPVKSYSCTLS